MKIIDGKAIAHEVEMRIKAVLAQKKVTLSLASLFVGEAKDSSLYTKRKAEAADRLGVAFSVVRLPVSVSAHDVEAQIKELNERPNLDGYIVQLPLPDPLRGETDRLLNSINPDRDVDGLTEINREKFLNRASDAFPPTPVYAVMTMLSFLFSEKEWLDELQCLTGRLPHFSLEARRGKRATIISDGDVFGTVLGEVLSRCGVLVQVERSSSATLHHSLEKSSLIITAVGKPGFLKGDVIPDGAIVIDVGTSLVDGKTKGDVDWESVQKKNITITPVPGGVGPVTVAMLYANLLNLKLRLK